MLLLRIAAEVAARVVAEKFPLPSDTFLRAMSMRTASVLSRTRTLILGNTSSFSGPPRICLSPQSCFRQVAAAMSTTSTSAAAGAAGSYEWSNPSLSPASLAQFYNEQLWPASGGGDRKNDEGDFFFFDVLDPATRQSLCSLRRLGGKETREAVAKAHAAFTTGGWSQQQSTAQKRYDALVKWEKLVRANAKDLATLVRFLGGLGWKIFEAQVILPVLTSLSLSLSLSLLSFFPVFLSSSTKVTLENGKPLSEATTEVTGGADSLAWFAEEARRVDGDLIPGAKRGQKILVMKQPVGVVGAITPWNFPFSMITRKIGPALAAGCTVVLKPSEDTPLSALALVHLAQQCGFPSGCIQVVCGDAPEIGKQMMESKQVRKIGFTGSTQVGKLLMAQSAQGVKRISLELGGNAPFIVFDDADLDKAASALLGSGLRNAGQTCICADKVLVHDKVYEAFAQKMEEKMGKVRVGHGMSKSVTQGPLINERAMEKVEAHVADAKAKGAQVITGGKRSDFDPALSLNGYFYEPTLLTDVKLDMDCFREENFGPLLSLYRFHDDEEAIQVANDSEYGLAAYFYTTDAARQWKVSERLEYGMVGCNDVLVTSVVAPFGGWKQSGIGLEHSKYGIDEFLQKKAVFMSF